MSEASKQRCALCFATPDAEDVVGEGEPLCERHGREIAAIRLRELVKDLEGVNWQRVQGLSAAEAAQLQQRLREAHIATLPAEEPIERGGA